MDKIFWTILTFWFSVYFNINALTPEINDYQEPPYCDNYQVISHDNIRELQRINTLGWGIVMDVVWLPSTGNLAIATSSGVWIIDPNNLTTRPIHRITKNGITSIMVSEDESILITTNFDSDVTLWETNTGLELFTFKEHQNATINAYYSSEHNFVLSIDTFGNVIFREITSQKSIWTIQIGDHAVVDVNITSINPTIVIANSETHTLSLRDIKTGANLLEFVSEEIEGIEAIAFSPNNSIVAIGGRNGIRLWYTENIELDEVDLPYLSSVSKMVFSNDGEMLAYGDAMGNVYIYEVKTGTLSKLEGLTVRVAAIAFHENSRNLAAVDIGGSIRVWDINAMLVSPEIRYGDGNAVTNMMVSNDTKTLITMGGYGEILLWDLTQSQVREVINASGGVEDIALNPVDESLAIVESGRAISLWDINSAVLVQELNGDGAYIGRIAFSEDGKYLVSVGEGIKFWDVQSGTEISSQPIITEWPVEVLAYGFSDLIAFATIGNGEIYVWDTRVDTAPQLFGEHGGPVSELVIDHSGQYLASTGYTRVNLWELTTGNSLLIYENEYSMITDIMFNQDSTILFFGEGNRLVAFDIDTQREILNLEGNFSGIRNIEISKDDKLIYIAGADGTIQIWGIVNEGSCSE